MLTAVIVTALSVSVGVATAASPASSACFDGGWRSLQTDNGGTFENQGSCIKYSKDGGALFNPQVIVVSTCSLYLALSGSGFHANSVLTLTLDGAIFEATGTNTKTSGPTDGQGTFAISPVIASATPPVTIRVSDAEGVNAVVTAAFSC
jgi:hypothetical protein